MNLGIGGFANLVLQDKNPVLYEYRAYNLNEPVDKNVKRICDGTITIITDCFPELEIHEKLKKLS